MSARKGPAAPVEAGLIPFGASGRDEMQISVYRSMAWVGFCLLIVANAARAESVLNFEPLPISAGNPEFIYTGGATGHLLAGPGSIGNGDGALPPNLQTQGGLLVSTPFLIPNPIAGKTFNGSTTNFYDVTMILGGFAASSPSFLFGGSIVQPLSNGTFNITATDGTLLLTASATDAFILRSPTNEDGSILSATISYTGGVIGSYVQPTPASISFTLIATPATASTTNGYLDGFSADANGQFSGTVAVPIPASVWGGTALLAALGIWKWMNTRANRRAVELIPIGRRR
jgi:hypothetical protein